jgi:hypothetical protein
MSHRLYLYFKHCFSALQRTRKVFFNPGCLSADCRLTVIVSANCRSADLSHQTSVVVIFLFAISMQFVIKNYRITGQGKDLNVLEIVFFNQRLAQRTKYRFLAKYLAKSM